MNKRIDQHIALSLLPVAFRLHMDPVRFPRTTEAIEQIILTNKDTLNTVRRSMNAITREYMQYLRMDDRISAMIALRTVRVYRFLYRMLWAYTNRAIR